MTNGDVVHAIAALGDAPAKDVAFRINVMRYVVRRQARRDAAGAAIVRCTMVAGAMGAAATLIMPLGDEGVFDVALFGLALTTGVWAAWALARAQPMRMRRG
jgi:hypothetical protein